MLKNCVIVSAMNKICSVMSCRVLGNAYARLFELVSAHARFAASIPALPSSQTTLELINDQ